MRLGALVLGAMLLSGCFSGTPNPTASTGPQDTPREPVVQQGRPRIFSFVVTGEPSFFSPVAVDDATRRINSFLYSSLYRVGIDFAPVPDFAAAGVKAVRDKTWRVTLRKGIRFHDGSAISASDVAFTYRLALSPNCPFGEATCRLMSSIASVTPHSALVVNFTVRRAVPTIVSLGMTQVGILPERAVRASYERFRSVTKKVDARKVAALTEKIGTATNDQKCFSDSPPPDCDLGAYTSDLESVLRQAGIGLPELARFRGATGTVNRPAYASALLDLAEGLVASLQAKGVDSIAAAFPLLDFQRNPVGSGPYALTSYRPGESVELTRKAPDPTGHAPTGVRVTIIADPSSAATALKTGDVDWLPDLRPDEVPSLENDPLVHVAGRPGRLYRAIVFNVRAGRVYAERATRQAFAMCLDRAALVAQATSGRAEVAWSPTSPASWVYRRADATFGHDASAATALLEKQGWRRGSDGIYVRREQRLSSQIFVRPSRADQIAFGSAASDQLRSCGIELRVTNLGFSGDVILRQIGYPNDFDTYLAENPIGLDPSIDFSIFSSSRITTQANPGDANYGGWSSTEADRLIQAAAAELKVARRRALYARLQDVIAREVPLIPLWYDTAYAGVATRLARPAGPIDPRAPFYDWDAADWILTAP